MAARPDRRTRMLQAALTKRRCARMARFPAPPRHQEISPLLPRRTVLRRHRPPVPRRLHPVGTPGHHRPGPHLPGMGRRAVQRRHRVRAVPPGGRRPRHTQARRRPAAGMGHARRPRRGRRARSALPPRWGTLPGRHVDRAHPQRRNAPFTSPRSSTARNCATPRGRPGGWGGSSTRGPVAGTSSGAGASSTATPTRSPATRRRHPCPGG